MEASPCAQQNSGNESFVTFVTFEVNGVSLLDSTPRSENSQTQHSSTAQRAAVDLRVTIDSQVADARAGMGKTTEPVRHVDRQFHDWRKKAPLFPTEAGLQGNHEEPSSSDCRACVNDMAA